MRDAGTIVCSGCRRENRPGASFCDGCGAAIFPGLETASRTGAGQDGSAEAFVGRERELETLGLALAQALTARGRILAVSGEPGIGKTRTAQVLARYAAQQNALVLWGRCFEEPGAPPYWPWLQLFRGWLGTQDDPAQLAGTMGDAGSYIAGIVPELALRIPDLSPVPPTADASHARFRLFDAIAGFLKRAAEPRGLVVILDNLHWADAPSLRLLEFLAPEIGSCRLLVLFTYRDIALTRQHPLSNTLGELARHPGFQRLRLTGLTLPETGRFMTAAAGQAPPSDLLAAVHVQTEGNPLFIGEMARFLVQERLIDPQGARLVSGTRGVHALRIPEGVREVIGTRLNRLSPLCNRVLTTAAVVGRNFGVAILSRLLPDDLPPDEPAAALEEALAASVIEPLAEPDHYQFSHTLIRETLYEEIPAIRRSALHLAVGSALEKVRGMDPAAQLSALAYHFCAALPGGDSAKAVEYARRAAARSDAMFAFEEAARLYLLALQALDDTSPAGARKRLELLIALGEAQTRAGENLQAAETIQQAAGSAKALGLATEYARAARAFEEATWRPGLPGGTAARLLKDALAGLPTQDSLLRVEVLGSYSRALIFSGEPEFAAEVGAQAEAMARRLNDPIALSVALRAGLSTRWQPEQFATRMAKSLEALRLLQQVGDKDRQVEVASWRLFDLMELGDLKTRAEEFETYSKMADELRQPFYQYVCISSRAMVAQFHGQFLEAERIAREALEFGRRMPSLDAEGIYGLQMFSLRREQGGLKELAPLVEHFVHSSSKGSAWLPGLTLIYCELGKRDEALIEFEQLASEDFSAVPRDAMWVTALAYMTEVCTFLEDDHRASTLYGLLLPHDSRNIVAAPNIACYGAAARYLGMLAATMKHWADAERHFESALAMNLRQKGWPWLAHTQHEYARMLLARGEPGDRARAASLFDDCLARADKLGMKKLVEQATTSRGSLARATLDEVRHPAGLSNREVQVLRLVAAGRSNREIAERLFVSSNTVANHVRSILTKTRTSNRTEAAAFALRHLPGER